MLSWVSPMPALHAAVAATRTPGQRFRSASSPAMWSQCSWVRRIRSGVHPSASSRSSGPLGSLGSMTTARPASPSR